MSVRISKKHEKQEPGRDGGHEFSLSIERILEQFVGKQAKNAGADF
ncbi:MAG: hypothetical protein LWX56_10450 [Ignavibacteria bacterium]|nr:hypothetical protein [Ignavibacteria bacterium]